MKKTIACAFLISVLSVSNSHAELIAFWNFNSGSSSTTGVTPAPATAFNVTHGSGTLSFVGGPNGGAAGNVVTFAGTVTNLPDPDPDGTGRGVALAVQAGDVNPDTDDRFNNGSSLEFGIDMSGYRDLVMSYAVQRTSTGFTSNAISVSTDGGATFDPIVTFTDLPSSFGTTTEVPGAIRTVDFGSLVNDLADVRIRLTMDGGTATSGNNRFDNIQFNALIIPEPASFVLMLLASVALIGIRRRTGR